jgi:hypothetical protein
MREELRDAVDAIKEAGPSFGGRTGLGGCELVSSTGRVKGNGGFFGVDPCYLSFHVGDTHSVG